MFSTKVYYSIKSLIPRRLLIILRRNRVRKMLPSHAHSWPIDRNASKPPQVWSGWPERKKFALILTHDVDCERGLAKCEKIMDIEENLGFKSCFYFVPELYRVPIELRHEIEKRGFEVGVHGLKHDGKLYNSRKLFRKRADRINQYIEVWKSIGFRSPSMHHNLDWIRDLEIEYDSSTFDIDPFEPQPDGVGTIFPFIVPGDGTRNGYIELPYTLPQDVTLFVMLKENSINIWKKKLDWIAEHGGMALLNVHPDYMDFDDKKMKYDEYPAQYYEDFLKYIRSMYKGQYWHVLPWEMARFWKNSQANTINLKNSYDDRRNADS